MNGNFIFQVGSYTVNISSRMFEWCSSLILLGMGVVIALPGDTARFDSFFWMTQDLAETYVALFLLTLGLVRLSALAINGHFGPAGPRLRAIGAIAGATVWGQMFVSVLHEFLSRDRMAAIGLSVFLFLSLFELLSAYRASADASVQLYKKRMVR